MDILCDTDLEELKQNTLAYARHLEEYGKTKISYRNCQKNQNIIQWNDEIFSTPLPHPKYNLEFIKAQINCDKDNKMIDRIDDIQTRKNEVVVVNCSKTVSTCTVETIEDLEESKTNGHFKGDTINEEENKNDVLELNIMPQCQNSIENLLQIKKMNLEDNVLTNNFDEVLIVSNTENSKMELLKKSVNKWKTVITKKNNNYEKTENQPLNKHNKKIDDFLQNIQKYQAKSKSATNVKLEKTKEEEKKPKSSTSLDNKISSYQYRFKAQKNIIEMQKEKLQEQVKIIEELKLNKIYQQASDSLKEAQKTKRSLSPQKVKQVKKKVNEENDKEENERTNQNPSLYFTKAPKIVVQMEERAKEREEKRLIIKERRRLIEEDKKKQMELVLQKKMRDEMEERDKQKEKMRVQRERVRQLEIKRQQDKKRYIELNEIAQRHYKIKLMKNNGMDHFKMLIFRIRINMEIAKRFYENNLIINCFKIWKTFTQKEICYKNELADELYNSRILKIALRNWKTVRLFFGKKFSKLVVVEFSYFFFSKKSIGH